MGVLLAVFLSVLVASTHAQTCYLPKSCEEGAQRPSLQDCAGYHECSSNGWLTRACAENESFDMVNMECKTTDYTCAVRSETCEFLDAPVADPTDCTRFYQCTTVTDDTYSWLSTDCADGGVFDWRTHECVSRNNQYECHPCAPPLYATPAPSAGSPVGSPPPTSGTTTVAHLITNPPTSRPPRPPGITVQDMCTLPSTCDTGALWPYPGDCTQRYKCFARHGWRLGTCGGNRTFDIREGFWGCTLQHRDVVGSCLQANCTIETTSVSTSEAQTIAIVSTIQTDEDETTAFTSPTVATTSPTTISSTIQTTIQDTTASPSDPDPTTSPTTSNPTVPTTSPTVPTTSPTVPTTSPTIPTTSPTVPTTSPTVPTTSPTVPTTSPTVPTTSPTVPTTSPTVPTTSPTVPITSPTVPTTSPTIPTTSPTVPTTSPTIPTTASTTSPINPTTVISTEETTENASSTTVPTTSIETTSPSTDKITNPATSTIELSTRVSTTVTKRTTLDSASRNPTSATTTVSPTIQTTKKASTTAASSSSGDPSTVSTKNTPVGTTDSTMYTTTRPFTADRFCPLSTTDFGTWPKTKVFEEAQIECDGRAGVYYRQCIMVNGNAMWDNINNLCVDENFSNLLDQVSSDPESVNVYGATAQLSHYVEQDTNRPGQDGMSAGNLNCSLEVLDELVQMSSGQSDIRNYEEQMETLVEITSSLIAPENEAAWDTISEVEPERGEEILEIVEELMTTLADTVNETVSIVEDNIAIELRMITEVEEEGVEFSTMNIETDDRDESSDDESWIRDADDMIRLEKESVEQVKQELNQSHVVMWTTYYKDLSVLPDPDPRMNLTLNSRVLSLNIMDLPEHFKFEPRIHMEFTLTETLPDDFEALCSFWKFSEDGVGRWSQDGCQLINDSSTSSRTVCECDHLTNFAVLMRPTRSTFSKKHEFALELVSTIGCVVSVVALFITIILHILAWKHVKSHHNAVLMNLCVALILANVVFLVGIDRTEIDLMCTIIAGALHYFFLAAFFLMLADAIAFLFYTVFVLHVRRNRETFGLIFCAWFVPAIIVGAAMGITKLEGYGTDTYCWLSYKDGLFAAFVGPVAVVLLINFTILVVVLVTVCKSRGNKQKSKGKRVKSFFWNILVIMPLLGITWTFALFAINSASLIFTYLFCAFNSFQGVFICTFHCILNKKLREGLTKQMNTTRSFSSLSKSSRSSKSRAAKHKHLLARQNGMPNGGQVGAHSNGQHSTVPTSPRMGQTGL